MTMPSSSDLSYFLEVASTLNVSRAAERLGITQPSLSLALKRLETSVGVPLLIRGKSGVALTKPGQYLAQRAKSLIQDWEALRAGAQNSATGLRGSFSLGCHVSVAHYALPPFVPQLFEKYPQIELRLDHDLSRKVTERVIRGAIDFGIVVNPVSHPDLVIQELCTDRVTLWSKSGKYESTLIHDPDLHQTQVILQKLDKKNVRFTRSLTTGSLEVATLLAASGAGTAILPTRVARQGGPKLKACPNAPGFDDRVCLVYRVDAQKTAAARAVIEAIRKAKI